MTPDPLRRVRRPCSSPYGCGRIVQTQAKVEAPVCQRCRARLRNLKLQRYRAAEIRRETARQRRDYWRGYKAGRRAAEARAA